MRRPLSWDIFCRVVDNFGDVGVCWRLARQLVAEHDAVRLWVDDLAALRALCHAADPLQERQSIGGVEIRRWHGRLADIEPAQVVIEAFGCGLPESCVNAMASRTPHPLWIVLEHLSAEPWVAAYHGLPSPHPRWPIPRYFFFPGFVPGTGGVLREGDFGMRRKAFGTAAREALWQSLGFAAPDPASTAVSLFAYEHAPVAALFDAWKNNPQPIVAAVPVGKLPSAVAAYFGGSRAAAGQSFRSGPLEVRIVPFVEQQRYDELLWACDVNFVRGEDSFVRAQWAAHPLVWQPYPQAEQAHERKLEAFLTLYGAGLPDAAGDAVRGVWRTWNGLAQPAGALAGQWRAFRAHRGVIERYARGWAMQLAALGDMAQVLARFCAERVQS